MKLEKRNYIFTVIYFMVYFGQAFSYCLLITYMTNIGYTATQRGIFFMGEALAGTVMSVISGYLCDRYNRIKPFWYMSLVMYMAVTWLTFISDEMNFVRHFLLVMNVGGMLRVSGGLIDALTLQYDDDCRENFGTIRAFGSIGWAVCAPITAWLVEHYGYPSLGTSFIIATVVLIIISLGIHDISTVSEHARVTFHDVSTLFNNRHYVTVTVILLLFFIVDSAQGYGVADKVAFLNGGEKELGYYWALSAMMELPLFFYGQKVVKRFGGYETMAMAGLMFVLRFIIFGISTSIAGIYVGGTLQAVTYPLLLILSKTLVDEQTPLHLKTSGQQVASSVYGCGSALLAPLIIGVLEDGIGINHALYAIAALALISTFFTVYVMRKSHKYGAE